MLRKRVLPSFFAFSVFLLSAAVSFSATDESASKINVKAEVNKAFITIGVPVEYKVTVKHDPSVQILSVINPPSESSLKIKKEENIKGKEKGRIVEGKKFTLTAYGLGDFVLDPIKIEYRMADGEPQTLQTEPIYLSVKSVASGEQKVDIRSIKSVLDLPKKVLFLILIFVILAVAAICYWIYRRFRKQRTEPKVIEPDKTAEEEAFMALNQLFDSDLIRRAKIKEYYLKLSEILRSYFERRFQMSAVESTTDEILREMRRREIDTTLIQKITEVLEAADLAKFAKWKPEAPQIVLLNQKSKQIIEEAKPKVVSSGI